MSDREAMSDSILMTGDQVIFLPAFGKAVVVPVPGVLAGSGKYNLSKKPVCVEGDEKNVLIPGCPYVSPPFVIPGVGTLSIESLAGDQTTQDTQCGGKAILLKGGQFTAKFEVATPAQMPPTASSPDATPSYSGNGMFITTNLTVKAS